MKVYEEDVVDTFKLYLSHYPATEEYLFYPIKDNPCTNFWYAKGCVSKKNLNDLQRVQASLWGHEKQDGFSFFLVNKMQ